MIKGSKKVFYSLLILNLLFVILMASSINVFASDPYTAYLFVYFTGESSNGEQTYFSVSRDGLNWIDLNNSEPVLISNVGEKGVRDQTIIRSEDGSKYWILATDLRIASGKGWDAAQHNGSKSLVIWESSDLVNWSAPRLVNVASSIPSAGCVWAPEAIYDETTGYYVVYWATVSPLNGVDKARIYYSTTKDFVTFSEAKLYIDRSGTQDIIDTQIIKVDGKYKYIRASKEGQINHEGSNSILGTWTPIGNISHLGYTAAQVEGPIFFKFNNENKWGLLVDQYAAGKGYLPLVSNDLTSTNNYRVLSTSEYSLGANKKRHGSILNITDKEYNALVAKWPSEESIRIQSYNYPDRYVRHYDFKARIDADVSPFIDSMWKIVPGLANSSGYISFQSVNYPGYYLRQKNFEIVLEKDDGTRTFKEDATFKKVPGLKDSSWSSFQSYNYPTRYIRHYAYKLKLEEISTDIEKQDATFKISNYGLSAISTPTPTATITPTPTSSGLCGDLNDDRSRNAIDFALLRSYLLGKITSIPSPNGILAADVNGDTKIDAIDFAYYRQFLLGLISAFPAEKI
jgi:sucrose-6-phosphate hydrolase SacC (GH32 family)